MALFRRMIFRSSFLALWAVVMTTVTVVLGAPPLRVLRLVMGRFLFWILTVGLSLVMFGLGWKPIAIVFLLLTLLVGFYSELLESRWSPLSSAAVAVSLTSIIGSLCFVFWTLRMGKGWYLLLLGSVKSKFEGVALFRGDFNLGVEDVLLQAPSGVVVLLLLASALLLVTEPRIREWAGKAEESGLTYLKHFRLPDAFVWITIVSLLGSFLKSDFKWTQVLAINFLNVCVLLYFFQGLAVFTSLFDKMKLSAFWRVVWTILLILQLFIIVSVVGLVDYWMDFRNRFERRTKQINKTL